MVVKRVNSAHDLSDLALKCLALGRHPGFLDDPWMSNESTGFWGPQIDSRNVDYRCDCGRTKYEVINFNTGEVLSASPHYDGGELPIMRCTQREAKLIWLQRLMSRSRGRKRKKDREKEAEVTPLLA